MPAWGEVQQHLRGRFTVTAETDAAMDLEWRLPSPGGELKQGIRVSQVEIHKEPWLFIVADVCPETGLALRSAIAYQDHLGFGAIILRKGTYLLRHSLPMPSLAWDDLDRALRMVARAAVRLRLGVNSAKAGAPLFDTYDD
jgi:hypothetical protein